MAGSEIKNSVYSGDSEGFSHIVEGYLEFGEYTVQDRAVPDIRDGLKPVQRRLLLAGHADKNIRKGVNTKSVSIIGDAIKTHPHGDSALYSALVRMVEQNGSFMIPLFKGSGSFGRVYTKSEAAASRYTEVALNENALDFFSLMDGVEMVRNEAETGWEPSALPVRYPYVLCVAASGLAVSVNTQMPSFNFNDVIDLTAKYITKGANGERLDATDVIYPDFATGGHYIIDNREALNVMLTGKGALSVRADVDIVGKEIHVYEVPVGKPVEDILKQISKKQEDGFLTGIQSAYDAVNKKTEDKVIIVCKSMKVVQDTLMELYGLNILQSKMHARMTALNARKVVLGGVYNIIQEWVKWRADVVVKDAKSNLEALNNNIRAYSLFIRLIDDGAAKEKYLELATKVSKAKASDFLLNEFAPNEGYIEEDAVWVSKRSVSTFLNGGNYRTQYENMLSDIEEYKSRVSDPRAYILRDLEDLKKEHAGKHERKTKTTKVDYRFTKITESDDYQDAEDTSPAWFTVYRNGFMKKTRDMVMVNDSDILYQGQHPANETLIGFTNYGQIVRVYGSQVPFMNDNSGAGMYIPKYLGLDIEAAAEAGFDDFKIVYMGLLDGKERMLLFTDGKASFINTDKWLNVSARHKIIASGVNMLVKDSLVDVIHEDDYPDYMVVADTGLGHVFRYGIEKVANMRRPKGTVGAAAIYRGGTGKHPMHIEQWAGLTTEQASDWINSDMAGLYGSKIRSGATGDPTKDLNFDIDLFVESKYSTI